MSRLFCDCHGLRRSLNAVVNAFLVTRRNDDVPFACEDVDRHGETEIGVEGIGEGMEKDVSAHGIVPSLISLGLFTELMGVLIGQDFPIIEGRDVFFLQKVIIGR